MYRGFFCRLGKQPMYFFRQMQIFSRVTDFSPSSSVKTRCPFYANVSFYSYLTCTRNKMLQTKHGVKSEVRACVAL